MDNNYYNTLNKTRGTKFYGGRSPQDEILYGFDSRTSAANKTPVLQGSFMQGAKRSNPNFSALNYAPIDDKSYSAIYGYSSDPIKRNTLLTTPNSTGNNRPNTYVDPKNRFSAVSNKGGSTPPPNFKNNLLNYVFSPEGKGMAQGLLEASGYSDTPISFGQALAMGMKRGNEAKASASASELATNKFNYQKEQDILNRQLAYAQIKPASVPALQQNIRAMLEGKGLTPGTSEYDIAFADELQKYLAKTNSTSIDLSMKAENKGTEQMFN